MDEGCYQEEELKPLKNLVSALFRLENSRDSERIMGIVTSLLEWLATPEQASLRRAFTVWFNRVFFAAPGGKKKPPELEELTEVRTMLAETVAEWQEEWKRQGLEQGLEKGRKEGQANILLKQLEFKFGKLNSKDRKRVQSADSKTLLNWGERILTANTMAEIFRS